VRHADLGLALLENTRAVLSHFQITRGRTGLALISGDGIVCRNFLLADLETGLQGLTDRSGATPTSGEHGTFHRLARLASTNVSLALTNCLLVAVTNQVAFTGNHVANEANDLGIFQSAAAGTRYLAAQSPHRDAGTTAIDATLRQALRRRTTHPPVVLTGNFTKDTVLSPRAARDADIPDLGYHYAALDYCWGGLQLSHARLLLTNDVAIGFYGSSQPYGLGLDSGADFQVGGYPDRLARLVSAGAVQESTARLEFSATFSRPPSILVQALAGQPTEPRSQWRFAEAVLPGGAGAHLASGLFLGGPAFALRDCQLTGGRLSLGDTGLTLHNCLLDRVVVEIEGTSDEAPREFHHNYFRGGRLSVQIPAGSRVVARNNLFDQTSINPGETLGWQKSHNAWRSGFAALTPAGPTDRILATLNFEAGPLGRYYYPAQAGSGSLSTLIDAGSAAAQQLGLGHYTCLRGAASEGTSRVDIGFHYPAINARGQLTDTDGDGLIDLHEDTNGNGLSDPGETHLARYDSAGHLVGWPALQVFTPLK
jgi:hypothetical protein